MNTEKLIGYHSKNIVFDDRPPSRDIRIKRA